MLVCLSSWSHFTFHIFIESKRKNTAAKNTRKQSSVTMWNIKKLHQIVEHKEITSNYVDI